MFEWMMNGGVLTPDTAFGPGWHALEQGGGYPQRRMQHTLTALGDQLHLIGGRSESALNEHWRYSPASHQWVTLVAPGSRRLHTADVVGGELYLVAGLSSAALSTAVVTVQRYDPNGNAWVSRAPLPVARCAHGSAVADGVLWIHGGVLANGANDNSLYRYDPVANSWSTHTAGGEVGGHHRLVSHGGYLYQLATNGVFWRYSVTGNSWSQLPNPPTGARDDNCSFVAYGGYLWVWGGLLSTAYPNDLWRYSVATGQWVEVLVDETLPAGRRYHATALWGSRLVVHGGYSGSYRNDLWLLELDHLF